MVKKFLGYYVNHWRLFVIDILCAFLMSGLDLVFPIFIQRFIDEYFPSRNLNMIIRVVVILFVLYIVRFVLQYIVHYWGHVVGIRMETDMRNELFTHLQKLSFKFYDNNKIGYLISRIVNDLNNISELAHHGPEDLFISSVMIIGSFVIMFNMNWKLSLFTFLLLPFMYIFSRKLGHKMYQAFKNIRERVAEVNSVIEDSLSGIRVVKSFTNESYERDKFEEENHRFRYSREYAMKNMARFHAGMNFFIHMIRLVTLGMGGYYIYLGQLSTGQLIAFLFYVNMFMQPIRRLVNFNEQLQRGMAGFNRFTNLLDVKPEIEEKPNARELKNVSGEIKYRNVSFSYDNNSHVLSRVNIDVKPGQTIAFVGPSGAGKTTICNLLPRFYEIDEGKILIDGNDIQDLTLESLRNNIGLVQQDVFLFNGSIRDNILYGKFSASDDEMIEAAKKANAHQFIKEMTDGYGTQIGERGVKLSGGQKQRISIARSFLKNPPILILDEATSSLDNESEKVIQASLKRLSQGRTTLVIAHRLSTVRDADEILVLTEEGIVERGKHENLMEKENGVYCRLYQTEHFDRLTS